MKVSSLKQKPPRRFDCSLGDNAAAGEERGEKMLSLLLPFSQKWMPLLFNPLLAKKRPKAAPTFISLFSVLRCARKERKKGEKIQLTFCRLFTSAPGRKFKKERRRRSGKWKREEGGKSKLIGFGRETRLVPSSVRLGAICMHWGDGRRRRGRRRVCFVFFPLSRFRGEKEDIRLLNLGERRRERGRSL